MAVFVVDLKDKVSPNAKKAADSVTHPHDELKKGSAATEQVTANTKAVGGNIQNMGALAEEAAVAIEVAVVALAALAAAAVLAGAALAISEGEQRKALEANVNAFAKNEAEAAKLLNTIEEMTAALPLSKDRIEELSKAFMAVGIRSAPELEKALTAVAAASALSLDAAKVESFIKKTELFDEAGKNFKNFSKALVGTGVDVNDLAKQLGKPAKELEALVKSGQVTSKQLGDAFQDALIKRGGPAMEQANRKISVIFGKMKAAIADLFEGVANTPGYKAFVDALMQLGGIFGGNTAAAKGMKEGITSAFDGIFGIAAKVITWMTIGFLKLAIASVKFYIWLFPITKAVVGAGRALTDWTKRAVAYLAVNDDFIMGLKVLGVTLAVIASPFILLSAMAFVTVGAIVALTVALVYVAGWIANNIIPILKVLAIALLAPVAPILAVVAVFVWMKDKLLKWAESGLTIASDFVAGLILGLTGGMKKVEGVSTDLGAAMEKGVKSALDAHSPSRVMMELGKMAGAGLELGMVAANDNVADAGAGLGASAVSGTKAGATSSSGGGRGDVNITIEAGAVVINGAGKDVQDITEEAAALLFERVAMQLGAA